MNISQPFILRPVATTLLTIGLALSGIIAFGLLPVAPLPQVDFPTISVQANIPGASPETMAATVASPLEKHLGTIAGVTEMTSSSSLGSTRITLQFDLSRDINGAANDVQAQINAARVDLPTTLRSNPTYRKVNPADAPIMILALTSETLPKGQLYDAASTVLQQKLSQVKGIGEVDIGGSSLPGVRIELNPYELNHYGIALESIRDVVSTENANRPKGMLANGEHRWQVNANDQANTAAEYKSLVVAYENGRAVTLSDIGTVVDSVEDVRNGGTANGQPSVIILLFREPGANIIDTVDRIDALLPQLRVSIPRAINLTVAMDRTPTIRASLHDVEVTLSISISLVILVVFLFLRKVRATLIPSVAVPVSLIGTFGVMYLCGYSLDNLSLMALTIATGFVVDDAIVVLENVSRHMEEGIPPMKAALLGAREVGFTVVSMSLSLVAVFLPILLLGGIIGRLFREFAVTLSVAVLVSLVLSLTTTPMMCAKLLKLEPANHQPGRFYNALESAFEWLLAHYRRSLAWVLRHSLLMIVVMIVTIALNIYLYIIVPKGFFPQEDTGRLMGFVQSDQSISFQAMSKKFDEFVGVLRKDPNVDSVTGFVQSNSGRMFISLKPNGERKLNADQVIDELREKTAKIAGAILYLSSAQDIRVGGRSSNAEYQYTLQGDDFDQLVKYAPAMEAALRKIPQIVDVNSDLQNQGLQMLTNVNRSTASRLGVTMQLIDATLYDAFGQRQVSVIYAQKNQYHVVMEVDPRYWQEPDTLKDIYVPASANVAATTGTSQFMNGASITNGAVVPNAISAGAIASGTNSLGQFTTNNLVPLSAFATYTPGTTTLSVSHQGQAAAITFSFNLMPGATLGDATKAVNNALVAAHIPPSIHGSFAGTAQAFEQSLSTMWILILVALMTIYIVLGVLYESYVHPLTILSTLPSAGVGAILALFLFHTEFSIMALIGIILLIGIVKKNAIMIIDFALAAEREKKLSARDAIYEACLLRFRPIMMTTMAAMLGALPLALGTGTGTELRRPLGITIVGGLIVSQLLTLYTTPVVYLYLDRFRLWCQKHWLRLTARKLTQIPPEIA